MFTGHRDMDLLVISHLDFETCQNFVKAFPCFDTPEVWQPQVRKLFEQFFGTYNVEFVWNLKCNHVFKRGKKYGQVCNRLGWGIVTPSKVYYCQYCASRIREPQQPVFSASTDWDYKCMKNIISRPSFLP